MIAVLTSDASATTITYLKYLAALNDNYQTFNTAAELIVASGKIWHLNRRSLAFLNALSQRDNPVFRRLLQNLSELCVGNALFLEATHIDTVIDLLYKQSQLPEDSLDFIDRFLESRGTPDIESIVQSLRIKRGPDISQTALTHHLIHHDVPHYLEVRVRALHVICACELN